MKPHPFIRFLEKLRELEPKLLDGAMPEPEIDRADLAKRICEKQWDTLSAHEQKLIVRLLDGGVKNPPNRPKSSDATLKRVQIVHAYVCFRRVNPHEQKKETIHKIKILCGASKEYIYEVLREVEPWRLEAINQSADALMEWHATELSSTKEKTAALKNQLAIMREALAILWPDK
jgi:hypothetical protein